MLETIIIKPLKEIFEDLIKETRKIAEDSMKVMKG